jgi:hypothetical protein
MIERDKPRAESQSQDSGIVSKLLPLSPILQRRTRYAAFMLIGISAMLAVVARPDSNDAPAAIVGLLFAFIGIGMLVVIAISAVGAKLVGVVAQDVKSELAAESKKDDPNISEDSQPSGILDENQLSDTERALIKLLRNNDVPPDIVAESIREVLERRMGR